MSPPPVVGGVGADEGVVDGVFDEVGVAMNVRELQRMVDRMRIRKARSTECWAL